MPVHTGKDAKGCFAQWGSQKKYYFTCGNEAARKRAQSKAEAQGRAVRAQGWTGNQEDSTMAKHFARIVTNIKPIVRNDRMEGRDWLVVPTVMMVEGVHNGSDGPILYPADELAKLPVAWNHKPVVVYHPIVNGQSTTACDPIELTTRKIGVMMNTSWDGKLKTESWLQPERIEQVDKRVGEALNKAEMMEVSIGVYMDLERTEGEWNGEAYAGIARNLVPDHLAVLPDLVGACSIADGAGLLRTNANGTDFVLIIDDVDVTEDYIRVRQKDPGTFKEGSFRTIWISRSKGIKSVIGKLKSPPEGQENSTVVQTYLFDREKWDQTKAKAWVKKHEGTTNVTQVVLNEIGHNALWRLLDQALKDKLGGKDWEKNGFTVWVEEVYDESVIYSKEGQLYRLNYTQKDGGVELTGEPEEVVQIREYRTKQGAFIGNKRKGVSMDRKKIIDGLIENQATEFTEEDRKGLEAMTDVGLQFLVDRTKALAPVTPPAPAPAVTAAVPAVPVVPVVAAAVPAKKTFEQYMAELPPEIQAVVTNARVAEMREKERLIAIITANKRCTFTADGLKLKDVAELTALATLAEQPQPETLRLYTGQNPVVDQGTITEEPLLVPAMNFGKEKSKAV